MGFGGGALARWQDEGLRICGGVTGAAGGL